MPATRAFSHIAGARKLYDAMVALAGNRRLQCARGGLLRAGESRRDCTAPARPRRAAALRAIALSGALLSSCGSGCRERRRRGAERWARFSTALGVAVSRTAAREEMHRRVTRAVRPLQTKVGPNSGRVV